MSYTNPGDRPRSRFLLASTTAVAFYGACVRNQYAGLPIFKRPQMHLVYMAGGVAFCYAMERALVHKYWRDRRAMLFDTQREYLPHVFGTVDQIPNRLPDSITELDPHKPYWYPYTEEGETKEKYFKHLSGKDLWEGSTDHMKSKP